MEDLPALPWLPAAAIDCQADFELVEAETLRGGHMNPRLPGAEKIGQGKSREEKRGRERPRAVHVGGGAAWGGFLREQGRDWLGLL